MILWAKAAALGTPNSQRVEAIELLGEDYKIKVKMCGTGEIKILNYTDFCGVELGWLHDNLTINFVVNGAHRNKTKYPKMRKRKIK